MIALWNVNGSASKEEEIDEMMVSTSANCGVLTETWLRPGQPFNSRWNILRVDDTPRPGRPAGRVAILTSHDWHTSVVRRYIDEEFNVLWVRVHNACDIIAVYIRPGIRADRLQFLLQEVKRRAKYPFILTLDTSPGAHRVTQADEF